MDPLSITAGIIAVLQVTKKKFLYANLMTTELQKSTIVTDPGAGGG
jgi:hypothetical protein